MSSCIVCNSEKTMVLKLAAHNILTALQLTFSDRIFYLFMDLEPLCHISAMFCRTLNWFECFRVCGNTVVFFRLQCICFSISEQRLLVAFIAVNRHFNCREITRLRGRRRGRFKGGRISVRVLVNQQQQGRTMLSAVALHRITAFKQVAHASLAPCF